MTIGSVRHEPLWRVERDRRSLTALRQIPHGRPAENGGQEKNRELEKTAYHFCLGCIEKLKLEMNLFSVESTFDANKLTFFFTAEGRVDFRQLVKMLVKIFSLSSLLEPLAFAARTDPGGPRIIGNLRFPVITLSLRSFEIKIS